MAAETKQQTAVPKGKTDVVVPIALVAAAAGIGFGLYMYYKKPAGTVPQGSDAKAVFNFTYHGEGGDYILQVSLGSVLIADPWFDHVEGMTWTKEVNLPEAGEYSLEVVLDLTDAVAVGTYDAEALIRLPGSDWLEYLEGGKAVTKNALTVTEG
jgi:hypothetical protein